MKVTRPSVYLLVIVVLLANIASIVFGILSATGAGGLFHNTQINLSRKYPTELKPVPVAFSIIWPLVFVWTSAISVYFVVSFCLPNAESPVKVTPTLTPKTFLVACIVGFLSTVAWLFVYDRELLVPSFAILFVGTTALWQAVGLSVVLVYDNQKKLEFHSKTMLMVVRILVHNGLCLFATWMTVATFLNFTTALIYVDSAGEETGKMRGLVGEEAGSTIGLVLIFVVMVAFFVAENFKYEAYFRYVFSIFPVFVFAFATIVAELDIIHPGGRNLVVASVELGVACLCLLARIALGVFRLIRSPADSYYPTKKADKTPLV